MGGWKNRELLYICAERQALAEQQALSKQKGTSVQQNHAGQQELTEQHSLSAQPNFSELQKTVRRQTLTRQKVLPGQQSQTASRLTRELACGDYTYSQTYFLEFKNRGEKECAENAPPHFDLGGCSGSIPFKTCACRRSRPQCTCVPVRLLSFIQGTQAYLF